MLTAFKISIHAGVLAAIVALTGCDHSCVNGAIPINSYTAEQQATIKIEIPWAKSAQTCRVAGYLVMGPQDAASGQIMITRDGTSVYFDGLNQIHIQSRDGSLVSLIDTNKTGRFDRISYSAIDPADGQKYTMSDEDDDGRLDNKIGDKAGYANINGEWARFEKRGNQLGAIVAGTWQPLERHGRVWQLSPK